MSAPEMRGSTLFPEVHLLRPAVHADERGTFRELWTRTRCKHEFVQDNLSVSSVGTLRGLHWQYPVEQGKLVAVVHGSILDVVVDIRLGSPTFGKWFGTELSLDNGHQLWVPPGFAHGFLSLSEGATVLYKVTAPFAPQHQHVLAWDDPDVGIRWPLTPKLISGRDHAGLHLSALSRDVLPPHDDK